MRSWRITAVAACTVAVLAVAAGCGGGGSSQAAAAEPTATLGIISTNIDTATSANAFTPAKEGQALAVGDQVRTDPTGFAEITYHDGSWTRIEHNATLTIDELTDTGTAKTVKASIDTGDAWNRARHLTSPDDAYQLDTPVATAAVRGTAFATTCTTNPTRCTFSVLDGTVEITPHTGTPLTLHAGDTVTITADQPPPTPTSPGIAALAQDPFIADNLTRDHTTNPDLAPTTDVPATTAEAFRGTFTGTATVVDGNPNIPTGSNAPLKLSFDVTCQGDRCTVDLADVGVAVADGDELRFDGQYEESCPSGGGSTTTAFELRVHLVGDPASATAVEGTETKSSPDAASDCPGTGNAPVTYTLSAQRS